MNLGIVFTATDLASRTVNNLSSNFLRFDKAVSGSAAKFMKHVGAFTAGVAAIHAGFKVLSFPAQFIQEAAGIQDTLFQVKSVSGLASSEIEQMRKNFLKLSADLPVSAAEMANVAVSAAQLGIQGRAEIEKFSVSAIKLSKVLPELTPDAAGEGLAQLSNVLGVSIDDLDRLGSSMIKMKTTSTATGVDIVNAARRFGSFATKLGFTADQVIAYSAAFRDAGVTSEVGATAIQQLFTRMSTKTADFAKVMGVTTSQLQANMKKDLPGAINSFLGKLSQMDAQQVPQVLKDLQLSGARTIPVILGLTKAKVNLTQKLKDSAAAYRDGTLQQERFMELTKSFNAQMDTLQGSIQNVFIALGQPLLEPATKGIQRILGVLNPFLTALQDIPGLAEAISFSLLGLGSALVGGGLFVVITSGIAMAQAAMGFFGVTVGGILASVGASFAAALWPVLAFIAVAGALYLAWTTNFAGFRDFVLASFDVISVAFQSAVALFSGGQLGSALQSQLQDLGLDGFVNKLFSIRETVVTFFQGFVDGFNAVMNGTSAFSQVENSVRALFIAVGDLIGGIGQILASLGIIQSVGDTAFGGAADQGFQFGAALTSVILPAIQMVVDGITMAVSVVNMLVGAFNSANNFFGGGIFNALVTAIGLVVSVGNPLIGLAIVIAANWQVLVGIFNGSVSVISGVFGAIMDFVFMIPVWFSNAVTAIGNFFAALPGIILNQILNIPAYIIGVVAVIVVLFAAAFMAIVNAAISMVTSVIGFLMSLPGVIASVAMFLWTSFVTGFRMILSFGISVITSIITFISSLPGIFMSVAMSAASMFMSAIQAIPGFVAGIVSRVVGVFMALPAQLASIAVRAAQGFINALVRGITSQVSRITSTVSNMVGAVRGLLPGSDAKYGPLSDLTHSGAMLPVTFAKGIASASLAPIQSVVQTVQPIGEALSLNARPDDQSRPLALGGGRTNLDRLVPPSPQPQPLQIAAPEPIVIDRGNSDDGRPILVQLMMDSEIIEERMIDRKENKFRRGYNT